MAKTFSVFNGTSPTTSAAVKQATGTSARTMIQLSTSASSEARIVEWWWEGDASAAAVPVQVELLFGSVAATTLTAYVAGDIRKYDPNSRASLVTLGTGNSGWNSAGAGTEGTPATTFVIPHLVPPTSGIYIQYPLGREPELAVSPRHGSVFGW